LIVYVAYNLFKFLLQGEEWISILWLFCLMPSVLNLPLRCCLFFVLSALQNGVQVVMQSSNPQKTAVEIGIRLQNRYISYFLSLVM
jgi:hypothetical protein